MITVIPAQVRHFNDFGWLKTYWLFSFDTYHDPNNVNFGSLRVFNDDVVDPGAGFPQHGHAEMEIITIVLSGAVTHSDSMGNKTLIPAGDIQRMTAGTGIRHSEMNLSSDPLHLYQIWIIPTQRALPPSYAQRSLNTAAFRNRMWAVASSDPAHRDAIALNTDATLYMSDFEAGHSHEFRNDEKRRLFIYLTSGEMTVGGRKLTSGDQARIEGEALLKTEATADTRFITIEIP